jgi:FixJ family two-component response regulator
VHGYHSDSDSESASSCDEADSADANNTLLLRLRDLSMRRRYLLQRIKTGLNFMSQITDDLNAAIEEEKTVSRSADVLMEKLFKLFTDTAGDKTRTLALIADLRANTEATKAAILANTPAEPQ